MICHLLSESGRLSVLYVLSHSSAVNFKYSLSLSLVSPYFKNSSCLQVRSEEQDSKKKQLFNTAKVYLEQDWFFLTTEDAKSKSFLSLNGPTIGSNNSTKRSDRVFLRKLSLTEDGQNLVAASGIWKLHVVETRSSKVRGKNTSVKQVENLLYRAQTQLHNSKSQRNGSRSYAEDLKGGSRFAVRSRIYNIILSPIVTQSREYIVLELYLRL